MIKNNKGVTLISLVITILILGILTGISLSSGGDMIRQVRVGRIVSNMILVQAKVETIYEEYQFFNNDENYLVKADGNIYTIGSMGINITQAETDMIAADAGVASSEVSNWNWYKWDANTLESQGLDKNMLENNEHFFVNYEYGQVIFSEGTKYEDSNRYYSMPGLNYILENN